MEGGTRPVDLLQYPRGIYGLGVSGDSHGLADDPVQGDRQRRWVGLGDCGGAGLLGEPAISTARRASSALARSPVAGLRRVLRLLLVFRAARIFPILLALAVTTGARSEARTVN